MELTYELVDDTASLQWCAHLMVTSPPWSILHFTEQQLLDNLSLADLDVRIVANNEGTRVGILATFAHGLGTEPFLEYLCIDADWRGHGIGTQLIDYFETVLFPEADNVYMFVSDVNPDAMRLYLRVGYQQVGALANFNIAGQTEFLLRKTRRPAQQHHLQ